MAADAKIFNDLGSIYARNKEYPKAVDLFRKAIAESPDLAEAHFNLAELLFQNKDYTNAISEYKKVVKIKPQDIESLYKLGLAYMNNADQAKAIEQFEKALAINSEYAGVKIALEYLKNNKVQ